LSNTRHENAEEDQKSQDFDHQLR
jgi:hypothetical protein